MDSQQMQDFFLSTGDDGFVTLTYYTSGARSFYTKAVSYTHLPWGRSGSSFRSGKLRYAWQISCLVVVCGAECYFMIGLLSVSYTHLRVLYYQGL